MKEFAEPVIAGEVKGHLHPDWRVMEADEIASTQVNFVTGEVTHTKVREAFGAALGEVSNFEERTEKGRNPK